MWYLRLEVIVYTYRYNYCVGVFLWEASHPLRLCRKSPLTAKVVARADAKVKASCPAVYLTFVFADVVYADANNMISAWSATWSVHDSHVISACSVTWAVHDQPRDQCMIAKWSIHDSYVNSACSVTWAVHDSHLIIAHNYVISACAVTWFVYAQSRDQCMISHVISAW